MMDADAADGLVNGGECSNDDGSNTQVCISFLLLLRTALFSI